MANTVNPIEKRRLALYAKMPPPLRKIAEEWKGLLGNTAKALAIVSYDMGTQIAKMTAKEGEYGPDPVKMLVEYFGLEGGETELYNMRSFAQTFDRKFVQETGDRQMANGKFLSRGHWFAVMRLKEQKDREKAIEDVFKKSLSVNELELYIKSGDQGDRRVAKGKSTGRKPGTPTSPVAAIQKFMGLSLSFLNYEHVFTASVLDGINEMPPDKVNEALLEKLEAAKVELDRLATTASSVEERLETNIDRVRRVLESRHEEAAEAKAADAKEKSDKAAAKKLKGSSVKKKAKKAAKAAANGKAKKSGRPAAASV